MLIIVNKYLESLLPGNLVESPLLLHCVEKMHISVKSLHRNCLCSLSPAFSIEKNKVNLTYLVIALLKQGNKSFLKKQVLRPGKEAHVCDLKTWEAKAGRSQVGGQPELHSKTHLLKKKDFNLAFR
jgi:hypothetical protein